MPINRDAPLARPFPDIHQTYTARDTILYALGLGIGHDPTDPDQLRYTYEKGLQTLPTMGVILGFPGFWLGDPSVGADATRLLHGEQFIETLHPLPPEGTVIGRTRVIDVADKGPGKGALVYTERTLTDAQGTLLCRQRSTTFLRGDGGFGGPNTPAPSPHPIPDRAPDQTITWSTLPQAALIYRLSGDPNPLHVDPATYTAAGFSRPVLHGLCTFGIAGHALATATGHEPAAIRTIQARFTAPVFPGETIETDLWHELGAIAFRARIPTRNVTALNNGLATLATNR